MAIPTCVTQFRTKKEGRLHAIVQRGAAAHRHAGG